MKFDNTLKKDYEVLQNNAKKLEQNYLETKFPEEAQYIPLDDLKPAEARVVRKCINHERLNSNEFSVLKRVLAEYRDVINEYEPDTLMDGVDKTVRIINTETDLLNLLDKEDKQTLHCHIPIMGKTYDMTFNLLPITDSRAIGSIQTHVDLFKDFSMEEREFYTKNHNKTDLNPQEQAVIDKINQQIQEKAQENQQEIIHDILVNQLELPDSTDDLTIRRRFWDKIPFTAKYSIFMKVQDCLGLTDIDDRELFPDN